MKLLAALALASFAVAVPHTTSETCIEDNELWMKITQAGFQPTNYGSQSCSEFRATLAGYLNEAAAKDPSKQGELYGLAGWVEALN